MYEERNRKNIMQGENWRNKFSLSVGWFKGLMTVIQGKTAGLGSHSFAHRSFAHLLIAHSLISLKSNEHL